jgi:RND superfamily putative drug exporter
VSRGEGESSSRSDEGGGESRPPVTLRHPWRALGAALVVVAALAAFGPSLEEKLSPSTIEIADTPAADANALLREHFGATSPFPILLRGPAAELERQGPELIRTLRRDPAVTTLSPWDRGAVGPLRPSPRRALILVDFHVEIKEAVDEKVPLLERTLEEEIHPPVKATQTGFATLSRAIQDESIAATERAELIALPILLIVLLLVFRSPVAAAVPLAFGAVAVLTSRGLLALLTNWFDIGALALTVCTMMGLALGVDYALLLVSRFREELDAGADPVAAAWTTRRTAGRTTVFAGSTLVLSMAVAFFIVPGALLASLAATLAMVVVLTVLVAVFAGPPLLVLIGSNIDRWRIGAAPVEGSSRLMAAVSAALRRPALVTVLIGAVIMVLAAPALALKTGPFTLGQLPHDDPARQDAELIQRAAGEGFDAPYVIIAATESGTVTEPDRLAALNRLQKRIAARPGIQAVIGPGQVERAVAPLRRLEGVLASDGRSGPFAQLNRLGPNLGRAAAGVAALREGISQATYGAGLLAEGSGNAQEGAGAIARGIALATAGSERAVDALDRFATGARRLAGAQQQAARGALFLKIGIRDLIPNARYNGLRRSRRLQKFLNEESQVKLPELKGAAQLADERLQETIRQLEAMTVGRSDPTYAAAVEAARQAQASAGGLSAELTGLEERLLEEAREAREVSFWWVTTLNALTRLSAASERLADGLREIESGGDRLSQGADRLAKEADRLDDGLGRLGSGAEALAEGLERLTGGTSELTSRLGEAYSRSYPLQAGLERATVRVISGSKRLRRQARQLRRASPGLFDSGYFVLSALDGARGANRERAANAIDLDGGGQAASIFVISRYSFNSQGSIDLNDRLEDDAAVLAREADLETGVAGGAATLNTYSEITRERIPLVVAAITLATFLVLVLVLRALPLAAIAVGLNLATVGVAFGVLTLLFNVPEGWPLGGRTYIDAVGATMIFGVVFGLSIDYAVFLLVRMRERYDETGDHAEAISFGLERTARVITGAAAIMMAVFIAFAGASIATVSQLGVGLTVAVLLDATVVRIVLLPALMLLMGERVWWLPRPLERVLPKLNV